MITYKRKSLKSYYGEQFADMLGIKPQINRLLEIDRKAASTLLIHWRNELFDLIRYSEILKSKNSSTLQKPPSDHEIVKLSNENAFKRLGILKGKVKNESSFYETLISIVNITLLFIKDSPGIDRKSKLNYFEYFSRIVNNIDLIYPSDEGSFLSSRISKMIDLLISELEKEKPVPLSGQLKITKPDYTDKSNSNVGDDDFNVPIDSNHEKNINQVEDEILLSRKQVAEFYNISTTTLWRWEKKGSIPKSVRIGGSIKWRKSDIVAHIA